MQLNFLWNVKQKGDHAKSTPHFQSNGKS